MGIKGGGLLAVSPKEYVVPADVMAMLGNGNPDDGADDMDKFIADFGIELYSLCGSKRKSDFYGWEVEGVL